MASLAVSGPGVCAGMGTANSMHIATEALGMALPGSAPVLANGPTMWRTRERAGRRIVELVAEGLRPRQILTPGAFRNAVAAVLAISGSVNCLKHLQAIAVEAGCDVDVIALFEELAPQVPLLTAVKPNGDRRIDEFEAAGGAQALLHQLRPLLDLDQPTVAGGTLGDVLGGAPVAGPDVIRPMDDPLARHPGIVVVRGSLAPEGAVLKRTVADDGVAPVLRAGEGLPLARRGAGRHPRRGGAARAGRGADAAWACAVSPGMGLTSAFIFALDGAGLGDQVVVDHRRADVRPGEQGARRRRGEPGGGGRRPDRSGRGRRHDLRRRRRARRSTSRCPTTSWRGGARGSSPHPCRRAAAGCRCTHAPCRGSGTGHARGSHNHHPGGPPVSIDEAQLEQLRETLQADDYRLDVDVNGDAADVAIIAGPNACEECLVPKPLMQSMLGAGARSATRQHPAELSHRRRRALRRATYRASTGARPGHRCPESER